MSEVILKSDARKAILQAAPHVAYCIDNIKPINAVIPKEAVIVERIVDHSFPSHTVFECSLCDASVEPFHNWCGICGARFKEVQYVRNVREPSIQCP